MDKFYLILKEDFNAGVPELTNDKDVNSSVSGSRIRKVFLKTHIPYRVGQAWWNK